MATDYLPLARKIARPLKLQWPYLREEIDSAIALAVTHAAQSYDPDRERNGKKAKFSTFLRHRVCGAMIDVMRKEIGTRQNPLTGEVMERSALGNYTEEYGEVINTSNDPPIGWQIESDEEVDRISRHLPPRHGEVVRLHYTGELTHGQIGDVMGCSESRVGYMHREAIAMLRGQDAEQQFHDRRNEGRHARKERDST